jgi:hypothetical protein
MTPAVVILPVFVASGGGWCDKSIGPSHKREHKTKPQWPLQHQIPTDEMRRSLDEARRLIAQRREERAWRELAS